MRFLKTKPSPVKPTVWGVWLISFVLLIKEINGAFFSPPTPEMPGFESSGPERNGRAASFLSSFLQHLPPPQITSTHQKRRLWNAQSHLQTLQDPGAAARNSPGVPHSRRDLHTSASERPLARKVPGGDTTRLLSSPQIACTTQRPLQPPRRDPRHGLLAAGAWSRKVAQKPRETQLAEERDPGGSGARGLRPPREPRAEKRTAWVKRED